MFLSLLAQEKNFQDHTGTGHNSPGRTVDLDIDRCWPLAMAHIHRDLAGFCGHDDNDNDKTAHRVIMYGDIISNCPIIILLSELERLPAFTFQCMGSRVTY